ncbi:unnamed protein product [Schistosoma margrebowiei]|uniref:Uncharacterized protein n=1 Tax=Schistosoma margrebowiei TaxID=48269 RepID=A0A183M9Y0_9TREM|nr:unnamed protein product [Schistosoma margrebowiei]
MIKVQPFIGFIAREFISQMISRDNAIMYNIQIICLLTTLRNARIVSDKTNNIRLTRKHTLNENNAIGFTTNPDASASGPTDIVNLSHVAKHTDLTCALVQHVKEATRYNPDSGSSFIRLILPHYEDDLKNTEYMQTLGKSDHAVLTLTSICLSKMNTRQLNANLTPGKQIYKILYTQHRQYIGQ